LEENIPARKATMVFAMEDTQIEVVIPTQPEDVTRIYGKGLSLHGANAESMSAYDIVCSQNPTTSITYTVAALIKLKGDQPMLFVPEKIVDNYENFTQIDETEGYYVLCEELKEE
ncbi:MAG: hypothetical protein JXQ76_03295, partial [Campylobacterales bacterium]|nr:hypothetical protein [Campylobacterales bacterium]